MKGDVKGIFHLSRDGEYFFSLKHPAMLVNCTPPILPLIITARRIHCHNLPNKVQWRSKIQSKLLKHVGIRVDHCPI